MATQFRERSTRTGFEPARRTAAEVKTEAKRRAKRRAAIREQNAASSRMK